MARLRNAVSERKFLAGLGFAFLAGTGFEAVGAVVGPYLIDRGLGEESVGLFFALHAVLAMAAGSLMGGAIADRWGAPRAARIALLLIFAAVAILAAADVVTASTLASIAILTWLYVCIGVFTASSYALFMGMTDPGLGATQFSAFMGATNGCEAASAWAVGRIIPLFGYGGAFFAMGLVSLTALPLVGRITPSVSPGHGMPPPPGSVRGV
jgi:MFS transporter (putative signal transducer)